MSVVQALRAHLRLDTAGYSQGLRNAQSQTSTFAGAVRRLIAPLAAALGAAFAGRALLGQMQFIDGNAKVARSIGGTVDAVRALQRAGSDAGVGDMTRDLQQMNIELARAESEGGKGAAALRRLGLSARDLRAMDADERLAAIADRARELGLDAGQTGQVLRDLGVRNREMALLVMQGGDAIRNARGEIDALGQSISQVDAEKIESANDAMSRLGTVAEVLKTRIVVALAPALESMSKWFVGLMREGGALRVTIEALGTYIQSVLVPYWRAWVNIIASGVRWVADLVGKLSDASGGFGLLGAAVRGIGGALRGVLQWIFDVVTGFSDLIDHSGGFGEALSALAPVASEVWQKIRDGATGLGRMISSVAAGISAAFMRAFEWIVRKFSDVTRVVAEGVNKLFSGIGLDLGLTGMGAEAADAIGALAEEEERVQKRLADAAGVFFRSATGPIKALQDLRDAMAATRGETESTREAVVDFNTALDDTGGGGGGRAGAARSAVEGVGDAMKALQDRTEEVRGAMQNAFVGLVTGAKSLRQTLAELLGDFARMLANRAFQMIWSGGSGGGGGFLGRLFGGLRSFEGGGYTGAGARVGGLDGRGGFLAMLHPDETVVDHTRGGGGAGGFVEVAVRMENGNLVPVIARVAGNVVARAVPGIVQESVGAVYASNAEARLG